MKAIFLNAWAGQAGKPFFKFLQDQISEADIFCFQEVPPEFFPVLSALFKDWNTVFEVAREFKGVKAGQAIFLKKDIQIISSGGIKLHEVPKDMPGDVGFLLYTQTKVNGTKVFVGNVHGKTFPGDKLDTKERLAQSTSIIDFLKSKKGPKIIGGDFNLLPQAKAIKMFEENGYRNLIKDFEIVSTRNNIAWERLKNEDYFQKQLFADYCFTSPEVNVKNFSVPNVEISDHLSLIVEFDLK